MDEQAAVAAISRAQSAGVNFSDTAQAYGFGRSERLLGRALAAELRSARDTVVIATKGGLRMDGGQLVHDASPAWLRKGVEATWSRWAPTTSTRTKCTGPTRPRRSTRPRPRWPN